MGKEERGRTRFRKRNARANGKIGADDDTLRDATILRGNTPHGVVVHKSPLSVLALQTADQHQKEAHETETTQQERATTPLVDPEDGGDGESDVENVVDGVGDEVDPATGETGTFEDVDDVVHHDVHTGKLRPHLDSAAEVDTPQNAGLEEIEVGLGTFVTLELDLGPDFSVLEKDELILLVASTVKVGEDLEGLGFAALVEQPTGRLGEPEHADGENEGGDGLKTPWNTEGGLAVDIGAAEFDEVLEKDTPGDSPLSIIVRSMSIWW